MKLAILAFAGMLALTLLPAAAQETPVALGRVSLTAPGWFRTEPDSATRVSIQAPDRQGNSYRSCTVERMALPPQPGMTQQIINDRVHSNSEQFFSSSTVANMGGEQTHQVVIVDGIATADVVAQRAETPHHAHVRLFVLVEPDGSGLYYNIMCLIAEPETEAGVATVSAVMNSLRIAGSIL